MEIMNKKLHQISMIEAYSDPFPNQELLALGMSKGSFILIHVKKLNYIYCRFTIHREAIQMIKYLPKTKVFLTFCIEWDLKVWRIDNK
jgi:hypothetical protein